MPHKNNQEIIRWKQHAERWEKECKFAWTTIKMQNEKQDELEARAEKAEAEVERLKKEKENYRQSIFMIQQGTIKPEQVRL